MNTSVRPATITAGKTALAVVAILSLLLSLFAIVRPAIAFHEGAENVGPEVMPSEEDFPGGPPVCPTGSIGVRFGDSPEDDAPLAEGEDVTVTFTDGSMATVTLLSLANNKLTFEVEGGLAAIVFMKGGPDGQNVYDYTGFPGGGIAHDDGLIRPGGEGISHIDFCLVPAPKGSILIYKDDQTAAPVEDATFSVKNDSDEEVGVIVTDDLGFGCLDELLFGEYTVTETLAPDGWLPDPDTETVTVDSESTCDERLEGATIGDADATFTNTLLGSLLVLKTDGAEPLDGAEFSVKDSEDTAINGTFTSGDDGPGLFCVDGLVFGDEYTVTETAPPGGGYSPDPANPKTHVIDNSDDCETRLAEAEVDPDLTFVNTLEETGSITVVKEVDCEDCETRTIGYYFNTADQHEEETNALFAGLGGIMADGILFTNVDQVQQYRADDQDGTSDGHNGLSARGQLTLQYLAAQLNVGRNGEECDLASRVYNNADSPFDGWTVQEILDEADAAFAGTSSFSDQDIKSALDDINNSSHEEENPLSCEGSENGTLDGVTFDLFLEEDYPDGDPIDSQTTAGGGTAVFDELALDTTYVLVESGFPEGMTCEIVDVQGEGVEFTLNDDGTVTVELTANNPDVTITVVNDCDEDVEEELGSITIIKNAVPDAGQDFAFATTGTGLADFSLDDDADAALPSQWTFSDLAAGSYSVTESTTAGWTLTSINCSEGGIGSTGTRIANIELTGSENVTCTFVNTQDSVTPQGGSITIIKNAVPDAGQDFVFTTTGTGLAGFSLDDDADAALPSQQTFSSLGAGAYTVVEPATTGWTLTSISCSSGGTGNMGTRTASITLVGSENVTCTFVNTLQGGGTLPGNPPRSGTQGGNPVVPNTAMDGVFTSIPAAAILALLMLSGLAAAGYAARAEVRRRR